ncbi:MAG: hypothetical protein KGR23_13910, partial [Betaproteobacteria bacterium]|nr:hypothetical protein [Betaproteobacteria bacterium]
MKHEVVRGSGGRVSIVDSITQLAPGDAGTIVVCGSHGGTRAGTFALAVPLAAVFFNDGGVGKDGAGIAALGMQRAKGIAAGAVLAERVERSRDPVAAQGAATDAATHRGPAAGCRCGGKGPRARRRLRQRAPR